MRLKPITSPFLPLILLSTLFLLGLPSTATAQASRQCFYPDGTLLNSTDYRQCTNEEGKHSMCCALNNRGKDADVCLPNGLCAELINEDDDRAIFRQGCTDPTWEAEECLKMCVGTGENYDWTITFAALTLCEDNTVCCGGGPMGTDCCTTSSGHPLPFNITAISPATKPRFTTPIDASSTPTTSEPASTTPPPPISDATKIALAVSIPITTISVLTALYLLYTHHRRKSAHLPPPPIAASRGYRGNNNDRDSTRGPHEIGTSHTRYLQNSYTNHAFYARYVHSGSNVNLTQREGEGGSPDSRVGERGDSSAGGGGWSVFGRSELPGSPGGVEADAGGGREGMEMYGVKKEVVDDDGEMTMPIPTPPPPMVPMKDTRGERDRKGVAGFVPVIVTGSNGSSNYSDGYGGGRGGAGGGGRYTTRWVPSGHARVSSTSKGLVSPLAGSVTTASEMHQVSSASEAGSWMNYQEDEDGRGVMRSPGVSSSGGRSPGLRSSGALPGGSAVI